MKKAASDFAKIMSMDEWQGLLGFVITESAGDYDNSYEDMGSNLARLIEKHPEQIELIEAVITAISGYSFETIRQIMAEKKDYYCSL